MGLFDRIRKSGTPTEKTPAADKRPAKTSASTEAVREIRPSVSGGRSSFLLVTPRVSEKAAKLASKGTYVFMVPLSANKVEVRKAVEALYKVQVTAVRTVRGVGKRTVRGRIAGQRMNWKKALVTLKSGQKIELHEGV